MDISKLRELSQSFSTKYLEGIMLPRQVIDTEIQCKLKDLLELKHSNVKNLYSVDGNKMTFIHDSKLSISKFEGKIKEQADFKLKYEEKPFFEFGINYCGRLRKSNQKNLYIRIPGEGTYDPASSEPYLSKHDFEIITGFYSAGLYALSRGGKNSFERVFKVLKINQVYKRHKYLVNYMKYQISKFFDDEGVQSDDYPCFLKNQEKLMSKLFKKDFEDLPIYLNLYDNCENGSCNANEIFPGQKYWEKLSSERQEYRNDRIVKLIKEQNKNELYLLPNPEFIKQVSKLETEKEMYDIRVLIRNLDTLNGDYLNSLKNAMKGREEEGSQMKDLVKPYYSCLIF